MNIFFKIKISVLSSMGTQACHLIWTILCSQKLGVKYSV